MRLVSVALLLLTLFANVAISEESNAYRGQTTDQWLQQLTHPSPSARAAAAQAFVKIGHGNEDAVEPLIALLQDRDERVRFYAAYALGTTDRKHDHVATALIDALPDSDEHVRYATQWSLVQLAKQLSAATDMDGEIVATTLDKIETELLVAGALPGHVHSVREAIAGLQPVVSPPTVAQAPPLPVAEPPLVAPGNDTAAIDAMIPQAQGRAGRPILPEGDIAAVDALIQQLVSDDLHQRVKAIEALKAHGPAAIQRLFDAPDAIGEPNATSWMLTRAIAAIGQPVVPILLDGVTASNEEISNLATDALIEIGSLDADALNRVLDLIDDDVSNDLQHRALQVLIAMGPSAAPATETLLQLLNSNHEDDWAVVQVVEALGAIGPVGKQAVPAIIALLQDPDQRNAHAAIATALVQIDSESPEVKTALLQAFREADEIYAAIAIGEPLCQCEVDDEAVTQQLLDMFHDAEDYERVDLLRLIGKLARLPNDDVLGLLMEHLLEPTDDEYAQATAARALGDLGPTAMEALAEVLIYGDEFQQYNAVRALVEVKDKAAPALYALMEIAAERHADTRLRSLAAVALGQIGTEAKDAAALLAELAQDGEEDPYFRSMAVIALSQVDLNAWPILKALLTDDHAEVQIAVAYALCKIDPDHADGLAVLVQWLENDESRESSIKALVDIGESSMPLVVQKMNDSTQTRDTRAACLEILSSFDDRAATHLLAALNEDVLAEDAGWALRDRGNDLIPLLVASAEDSDKFSPNARTILSSVIEDMISGLGAGGGDDIWQEGHALVQRSDGGQHFEGSGGGGGALHRKSAAARMYEPYTMDGGEPENMGIAEEVEAEEPEPVQAADSVASTTRPPSKPEGYIEVDVYYGTNRKEVGAASESSDGRRRIGWLIAIGAIVGIATFFVVLFRKGAVTQAVTGMLGLILILFLGLIFWLPGKLREAIDKPGPSYGGELSEQLQMGVCQVTIPNIHREGELEAPRLIQLEIMEDDQKHIVLKRVKPLQSDQFFDQLDHELQNRGSNILVFVHGFNVSFEDAARRTAQMTHDLKFAGAAAFFSWPSQADWWKYRVDEKHVELSVDPLKQFLLEIAEKSNANTINLVAHSMGNRALTAALKEIDATTTEREKLFNQVILAAPDIDADIFRQRIAPAIVSKARRVTLYASSNDLALVASRKFNGGGSRAGDAGQDLVVVPGIETIDVSNGDSSLLGHSYYGDNVSVLRDIEFLLNDEPVDSRRFLSPTTHPSNLTYWIFQPDRVVERGALGTSAR